MAVMSYDLDENGRPIRPRRNPLTARRMAGGVLIVFLVLVIRTLFLLVEPTITSLAPAAEPTMAPTIEPTGEPVRPALVAPAPTEVVADSALTAEPSPPPCPTPAPRPDGMVVYLGRSSDCPGLVRINVGGGIWITRSNDLDESVYRSLPAQRVLP
jgi:hypothetical protein